MSYQAQEFHFSLSCTQKTLQRDSFFFSGNYTPKNSIFVLICEFCSSTIGLRFCMFFRLNSIWHQLNYLKWRRNDNGKFKANESCAYVNDEIKHCRQTKYETKNLHSILQIDEKPHKNLVGILFIYELIFTLYL